MGAPARIPGPTRAVRILPDRIAAYEQILFWTQGKTSRRAKVYTVCGFHGARDRDANDRALRGVRPELRDREKELLGAGIPHRLLSAILRVNAAVAGGRIEEDILYDCEGAGRLVDANQGS